MIIKTQAEWDALPKTFQNYTEIQIHSEETWITVRAVPENSKVVAWENSKVVAWGNSKVVAWGNSKVVAWGCVSIHVHSELATALLFGFSVAFALAKAKITKKAKTATIITPKKAAKVTAGSWLAAHGIDRSSAKTTILFKRVSVDFKTQEVEPNETQWNVGTTVTHPAWEPSVQECGAGKFHACPRPYFADEFRSKPDDRYIAIEIAVKDLYAWPKNPNYPHKIAFRKGKVLFECDKFGLKIGGTNDRFGKAV